jgi:hypothetical protein
MARASPPPLFGIPNQCFRFDCVGQLRSIRHRTTSVPKSASPDGRGEHSTLTGRSARPEDLVGHRCLAERTPHGRSHPSRVDGPRRNRYANFSCRASSRYAPS